MASVRVLAALAHDTAHHAVSGLSYLSPHVNRAARAEGVGEVCFNLLADPLVGLTQVESPLQLASQAFRKKFFEMLEVHDFGPDILRSAIVFMHFPTSNDYYSVATCRLETVDGKVFEKSVTTST